MTDLAKGTFTDHSVEVEVIEGDLGGEVNILRGRTTHGWRARRGGLRAFDWETEGYKKDETGKGTLCSTRQPRKRRGAAKATWLEANNNGA
jgi:hypothetical protein